MACVAFSIRQNATNRRLVSFVVRAEIAKMRRITHTARLFTPTYTVLDSWQTIWFGPSTGKEEL